MKVKTEERKYTAIEKSLYILSWYSKDCPRMSLQEISTKTKFNPTTTYRILQTLIEFGYIIRDKERKYCVGTKPVHLNMIASNHNEFE
jgi:DNA-binding IclR family transcriptional regulator